MTTAIAAPAPKKVESIFDLIERQKPAFQDALQNAIPADKFARVALTVVRGNTKLQQCTAMSLLASLMKAAQTGILPDGVRSYLIPYGNEATFIIGYKGLIELALRSGKVSKIFANVVCEKDHFDYSFGLNEKLEHRPAMGERGAMIGAYAYAQLVDGGTYMDVMSRSDIDAIRNRSKAGKSGPWVTDYNEMARKTVVRRLAKYLPMAEDLVTAAAQDDLEDLPEITIAKPVNGGMGGLKSAVMGNTSDAPAPAEIAGENGDVPLTNPVETDPPLTDALISRFEDLKAALESATTLKDVNDAYGLFCDVRREFPAPMRDEMQTLHSKRGRFFAEPKTKQGK